MTKFKNKKSKFIWDSHHMKLIAGRLPTRDGQLWKGENQEGMKMEMAHCYTGPHDNPYVPYWGWSDEPGLFSLNKTHWET